MITTVLKLEMVGFNLSGTCVSIRMYPEGEVDLLESKIAECVRAAVAKSKSICEQCGSENAELCDEPPVFRWISTLCPACKADRIALYNKKMEERERFKEEMLKKKADPAE